MKKTFSALVLSLYLSLFFPATAKAEANELQIFGWVEKVQLFDGDLAVYALLDTGAQTSSLDASGIYRFRKDGQRMVRFTVTDPETGDELTLEKPLVRNVRIIRHDGNHQRRPVIKLPLCLGGQLREVEVNLIDRSQLTYPMLLGRSVLQDFALVDAGQRLLHPPSCNFNNGR
ncbi:MAG: ATP-dependent zinc protease family protein [Wenzhouxiangella sp.]